MLMLLLPVFFFFFYDADCKLTLCVSVSVSHSWKENLSLMMYLDHLFIVIIMFTFHLADYLALHSVLLSLTEDPINVLLV